MLPHLVILICRGHIWSFDHGNAQDSRKGEILRLYTYIHTYILTYIHIHYYNVNDRLGNGTTAVWSFASGTLKVIQKLIECFLHVFTLVCNVM